MHAMNDDRPPWTLREVLIWTLLLGVIVVAFGLAAYGGVYA